MELRRCADELERNLRIGNKWRSIETCQGVRRRFLSASVAYRRALRRFHVREPECDRVFVAELTRSLQCRRSLSKLWTQVQTIRDQPTHRRLRLGGAAIATLRGADAYPSLNLRDRLTLLDLQQRILEWLRAPHDAQGSVLLQDLEGMVAITRQMNNRSEIQEHDAFVLREALVQLANFEGSDIRPTELVAIRLLGMDPQLDACLRAERIPTQQVQQVLQHLAARFDTAPADASALPQELTEASTQAWSSRR